MSVSVACQWWPESPDSPPHSPSPVVTLLSRPPEPMNDSVGLVPDPRGRQRDTAAPTTVAAGVGQLAPVDEQERNHLLEPLDVGELAARRR